MMKRIWRLMSALVLFVCALFTCAFAQELALPAALGVISEEAFAGSIAFESAVLPEGLKRIESRAFADCAGLKTVYVPASVEYIAPDAFEGCEDLSFVCDVNTYAASYALGTDHISLSPPQKIPVVLSADVLLAEMNAPITWTVKPAQVQEDDHYTLTVYLDGEIYASYPRLNPAQNPSVTVELTGKTGLVYALCSYTHAHGETTQTISETTQLAGEIAAQLVCRDPFAYRREQLVWELTVEGAAGIPMAEFLVYRNGEQTTIVQPSNTTFYRLNADESGVYRVDAVITDGLGRTLSVTGTEVTVSEEASYGQELTYRLSSSGDSYMVESCPMDALTVTIPDERNGVPVTEVADGAFLLCDKLLSVTLGKNVKTIGSYAFHGCSALHTVSMPDGLSAIGEGAFSACANLSALALPSSLKAIPDYMAEGSGLQAIVLPSAVESVGQSAFAGCGSLSSVSLNEGLTSLGESAFANCTALASITFPKSLTSAGRESFSGCTGLSELNLPETFASIGERAFGGCTGLVDLVMPAGVSSVGTSAFAGCENLKTVFFENINASIGEDAFAYCGDVEVRTFGAGSIQSQLERMGVAFRNTAMVVLTKLECHTASPAAERSMLWQVEANWGIAPYTYQYQVYCGDELQIQSAQTTDPFFQHVPQKGGDYFLRVTVSDSNGCVITKDSRVIAVASAEGATLEYLTYEINSAGTGYVITQISNLPQQDTEVVIPAYIAGIPVVEIGNSASGRAQYLTEVVIPDTVTLISSNAFSYCPRLKKVTLGSGVQRLAGYAFAYCDLLETINLPYGLLEIDKYAFRDCSMLKDVRIPSSVTKVEEYVFQNCSSLTQMTVPASITDCGNGMFDGCTQLQYVEWNVTNRRVPYYTFSNCTNLDTVTFGYPIEYFDDYAFAYSGIRQVEGDFSKLTDVDESAFRDCTRLESLTLPAKETYIRFGKNAMRGCTSLSYVSLDGNATLSAGEQAFMDCSSLSSLYCKVVRTSGNYAFANCSSLLGVKLDSTAPYAFDGCVSLQSVTFTGGIYVNRYCFRNCTSLHTISYLKQWDDKEVSYWGITIDHHAFQNCTGLRAFATPSPNNLDIGSYAFENCISLSSVTLPEGRGGSHVGEGAFKNCTALTTVSGARHLTSIGDMAFQNCVSLSSISFAPIENQGSSTLNDLKIGRETFANCQSLTHLTFDEFTVEIGENAFAGCDNLTVTTAPGSYAERYFAASGLGTPSAVSLPIRLSADVNWGKSSTANSAVEVFINLWNTQNGPMPAVGNSGLFDNSATKNLTVKLATSNPYWHTVELVEGSELPASIPYNSSVTVKALVKCVRPDPSVCPHDEHTLNVSMTAEDCDDYSESFVIQASFPQNYDGDWIITEPTVINAHTVVGGDVYVQDELVIQGAALNCEQNVYVQLGGTVKMEGTASISAANVEIQSGGGIDMQGGSHIRAESLKNEGSLSLSTSASKVTVDDFSVIGSGILNFAADGRITTDRFLFNTSGSHAALLTNGVIVTRNAQIRQGFYASEKQTFILKGDECTLSVDRTSPKQHFAALSIDCRVEGLKVDGAASLLGPPFECERFAMTENTIQEEIANSNIIAKEIYDKATAARLEAMTEAEKELARAMAGWYDVMPDWGKHSIQTKNELAVPAAYAQKAILGWVVEIASGMPDKWSDVNDVLRSLLASGTHGVYTYEDKGVTYEVYVKPVGGLTIDSAAMTVGRITVTTGGKTYEFTYSLNKMGIQQSGDRLLKVIREYARDEYVNAMNKAIEEAMGKENAKYALGVVKVIETSLIEEKSIMQVIADKYGKTVAKELISKKYPQIKKIIGFYNKWDKYIKQNQKIEDMISDVRSGEELPTDLMKEFVNLKKVVQ